MLKKYSELHPVQLLNSAEVKYYRKHKEFPSFIKQFKANFKNHGQCDFIEIAGFALPNNRMTNYVIHAEKWEQAGKNVFQVGVDIMNLFVNTDIGEISLSNISLPYDCFYISFQQAYHGYTGAYVMPQFGALSGTGYYVKMTTLNNEPGEECEIDVDFLIHKNSEKMSLEHTFLIWSMADEVSEASGVYLGTKAVLGMVANILLYLSLPKKDITEMWPIDVPKGLLDNTMTAKTKRQREVAEQKIREAGYTTIKYVGMGFQGTVNKGEGGDKATHWRRGHWRNQPKGIGRQETVLKWIRPTIIRADKGDPKAGHVYKV